MSVDALVFPDTRMCFEDLIHESAHLGNTVTFTWHLQAGDMGAIEGPFPLVHIQPPRGTQGAIDRVDRVRLDCYAEGTLAVNTLESITASIVGSDIDTPHGYIDNINVISTPEELPYMSSTLNMASAIFDVTLRPVN